MYWREKNKEVDVVLKKGDRLVTLEVKSGAFVRVHSGLEIFRRPWTETTTWQIGECGLSGEEFVQSDLDGLL